MVHVLSEVLRKVGNSLRKDGKVLIIQPALENPTVEVEMDGRVEFREVTNEQNFRRYLRATVEAIHQSVGEGLFAIAYEDTYPEGNNYHCKEYESLRECEVDRLSFCEDLETFKSMSDRIQKIVKGRKHRVFEYWKEYNVILRKKGYK
ncbi:hypothetical protein ACFLXI_09370 [Chloroflexota bacterium]